MRHIRQRQEKALELRLDLGELLLRSAQCLLVALSGLHQLGHVLPFGFGLADLLGQLVLRGLGILHDGLDLLAAFLQRRELIPIDRAAALSETRRDLREVFTKKLDVEHGAILNHESRGKPKSCKAKKPKSFDAKVASADLGSASATKMCRSIMIKGLEAMVIESFTAARAYGVQDAVLASLEETFPGVDWEKQGTYFFERAIKHGRRRAEEMVEAAATVRDIGLEPWSAAGTAKRQAFIADLVDSGAFGDPKAPREDWRLDADRLLAAIARKN